GVVETIADRKRVEDAPLVAAGILAATGEDAQNLRAAHCALGEGPARGKPLALQPTRGDRHDNIVDGDASHALGFIDGGADGVLGAVEMSDHPALNAFGAF